MHIAPQDLGPDYGTQIARWRGLVRGVIIAGAPPAEVSTSYATVGTMVGMALGMLDLGLVSGNTKALLLNFALAGGLGYCWGLFRDRRNAGKARAQGVTQLELAQVGKDEKDALKRDYLSVAAVVVALPTPHEESARRDIRGAVRSLGQAVAQLPPARAAADVGALRAEAGRLAAQAQGEPDPVIAASLTRQAEALRRRADTAARVAVLVRRGQTLRDEVAAQVQAFQAALTAAQINGGHGGGDFEALAQSVAQVMQEADALADARAELEAALAPAAPEQSAVTQAVGARATR